MINSSHKPKQNTIIFGLHATLAALQNKQRPLYGGYVLRTVYEAHELLLKKIPNIKIVEKDFFKKQFGDVVHQGIALEVGPLLDVALEDMMEALPQKAVVVLLDQITDPHNMGAILRAAAAFECAAVITTERHSSQDEGTIAKVASGALEHIPLIKETNLVKTMQLLKDYGFWIYGLDERGDKLGTKNVFSDRTAIVMGSEGKGLRRLVKESCDHLVALPTSSAFSTLNVATATAITLYEIHRQVYGGNHE